MTQLIQLTEKDIARFWKHVDKSGDCWIWTAYCNEDGYGVFGLTHKETIRAHRVSYLIEHGQITVGLSVCHTCDNPPCVRPSHLFEGTRSDNMKDMVSKGRQNFQKNPNLLQRGETHWSHQHPENVPKGDSHYTHATGYVSKVLGEGNPMAKITESQVIAIRNAKGRHKDIARQNGVSRALVGLIKNFKIWKHIK